MKRKYGLSDTIWSMFKIYFPNKKETCRRNLGTVLQQLLVIQDYAAETHANEKKAQKQLLNSVCCSSLLYYTILYHTLVVTYLLYFSLKEYILLFNWLFDVSTLRPFDNYLIFFFHLSLSFQYSSINPFSPISPLIPSAQVALGLPRSLLPGGLHFITFLVISPLPFSEHVHNISVVES